MRRHSCKALAASLPKLHCRSASTHPGEHIGGSVQAAPFAIPLDCLDQKEMSLPAHITIPTSSKTQAVIAYEALM